MGFIYKLTSPSGKSYIGMTKHQVEHRWKQHKSKIGKKTACRALDAALQKYGWDNMQKEVLEEVDNMFLGEREREWIRVFDTYNNGYNLTRGGDESPMLNPTTVQRALETSRKNPENAINRSIQRIARNQEEWSRPGERERRGKAIRESLNTAQMVASKAERHARMMNTKEKKREEMLSKLPEHEREKHRAYLDRKRRTRKARKIKREACLSNGTTLRTNSHVSEGNSLSNGNAYTSAICESDDSEVSDSGLWWKRGLGS